MDMTNLNNLRNDLDAKRAAQSELDKNAFPTEPAVELTEDDRNRIENMKSNTNRTVVVSSSRDGSAVIQQTKDYMASLDKMKTELPAVDKTVSAASEILKTVNSGDIVKNIDDLKASAKGEAMTVLKSMSSGTDIDDAEYLLVNDKAIVALQNRFHMTRVDDSIMKDLRKMPLVELVKIFPKQFIDVYLCGEDFTNPATLVSSDVKERLLAVVNYLITIGPDMDYLNEYIENQNKLIMASKRLLEAQVSFAEFLKDEKNLSQLVSEVEAIVPLDKSFWSKYIKMPNRINNEFAQRAVIFSKYTDAYSKILEDYPDVQENAEARAIIQKEIDESARKHDIFLSITNLDEFIRQEKMLEERIRQNKKADQKYLSIETTRAVDRIRRSKQSLPLPGFNTKDRTNEQIVSSTIMAFASMFSNYNKVINAAMESGKDDTADRKGVVPIHLDGVADDCTHVVFATVLIMVLGRLVKTYTKNDATKFDAISLDAYFQLACKLGTDVYVMTDVWNVCKPFTDFIVSKWCNVSSTGTNR